MMGEIIFYGCVIIIAVAAWVKLFTWTLGRIEVEVERE